MNVRYFARCFRCDWQPDPDARKSIDKQAEQHTKDTGHGTNVRGWAEEESC